MLETAVLLGLGAAALVLLAVVASWCRERAARRALLATAVTTTSGFRFAQRSGRTAADAVLILEGAPLDVAAREYVAQVHVDRGDRESLRFGRLVRHGSILTLEVERALGGREVVVFDVRLAQSG